MSALDKALYDAALAMFNAIGDDYKRMSWFSYENAFGKAQS